MSFGELVVIALGLSMDAFAVAICKGLGMRRINWKNALIIGLFFGGFQALMPLLGWLLGVQFSAYIEAFDHWIAFVLLAFIGGKMIWEALKGGEEDEDCSDQLVIKDLLIMAIATSIDALAVGVTFALLPNAINIGTSVLTIGAITFVCSVLGVVIGNKFGSWLMQKAQLFGGGVLIIIGLKILLEHLGVF